MRALQTAFIRCGAVKKAWAVYVQEICGQDADPEIRALFDGIGLEIVSQMPDATIQKIAAMLAQVDDLTERDRQQLYLIVRGR